MITTLIVLALFQEPQVGPPVQAPVDKPIPVVLPAPVDKPEPGAQPVTARWSRIDAVQLIVNEEAVTTDDFIREFQRDRKPITTLAEQDQRTREVAVAIVERLLKIQAGKDLGFDPKLVDRLVREEMDAVVDRAGGVMQLGNALDELDMDPQMLREDKQSSIYRQLWEGSADGRSAGPGGRLHVDRYVRPGLLGMEYKRADASDIAPTTVTLQELNLLSDKVGGAEKALALATSLRERALAGEDFTQLVDDYGYSSQNPHGITGPHDLKQLRRIAEVAEFLTPQRIAGDLSEPLPLRHEGELRGYRLLKIIDLKTPELPRFDSRQTQNDLRKSIETRVANFRRDSGIHKLLDAAYVWPPEAFRRPKPESQTP